MVPYAGFLYFGVALYVLLPTLAVRLFGRFRHAWLLLAMVAMLAVQYAGTTPLGPARPELAVSTVALMAAPAGQGPLLAASALLPQRPAAPPPVVREVWLVAGYALFQWLLAGAFLWARPRARTRWPYRAALALGLLPLAAAKFVPLLSPGTQFGYLGISYVTFRSLDVIFGIQDRLITALPPGQFLAYLFFFPTISAGPVDRYRRFAEDWKRPADRGRFLEDLDGAVHRVFTGFLYKFILAALVDRYWLQPAAAGHGFLATVSYMYAYSFYLFFDFAGYSAFAIAFSYLLGVRTPENFDRPFLARNIRDFWNRWNIGLSFWFRDHVYMRFVMAATKGKWFKGKVTASYLGFLLGFGLMGLWHGTAVHFLIYGVYHAALQVGYDVFSRWNKRTRLCGDGPLWRLAGVAVTFHLVCFGFLIFSGHLNHAPAPAAERLVAEANLPPR